MENREGPADHHTDIQATDEYHVSLADLEPSRGLTDCLDDVIFGLCDTSHTATLSIDAATTDTSTAGDCNEHVTPDGGRSQFCRHLRLTANADTVYLCDRQTLRILTTTSTHFTDDTDEIHLALTTAISNLNQCSEAFQLPEVRVFPDYAKLSITVIPVADQPRATRQSTADTQAEYLAIIVDADKEYRTINPCIAQTVQAIYSTFTGESPSPCKKQVQRAVFDQLKLNFNLCSEKITARRREIFFEDLRHVTVHFEKLLALNAISANALADSAIDSSVADAINNTGTISNNMGTLDSEHRSDPILWGWQSVASLIEDDQYPQALYQQADLWGETFTTALDIHILRESAFRYKEVCEAANLHSVDTIKPLCITVYSQSLLQDGYIDTVQQLLEMAVVHGTQLVLELSEKTSVSANATETESELREFKKHLQSWHAKFGIQFGLCEFGTGHSSLLRATTLNPDVIKLSAALLPDNQHSQLRIDEWADTVSQLLFGTISTHSESNEIKSVQILVDGTQLPTTTHNLPQPNDTAESGTAAARPQNSLAV